MGNCIDGCKNRPQVEVTPLDEENQVELLEQEENVGKTRRVKILLTKDECEWLMKGLKKTGGKRVEDLLGEIVRNRGRRSDGWKPCLDSITESPHQASDEGIMDR